MSWISENYRDVAQTAMDVTGWAVDTWGNNPSNSFDSDVYGNPNVEKSGPSWADLQNVLGGNQQQAPPPKDNTMMFLIVGVLLMSMMKN